MGKGGRVTLSWSLDLTPKPRAQTYDSLTTACKFVLHAVRCVGVHVARADADCKRNKSQSTVSSNQFMVTYAAEELTSPGKFVTRAYTLLQPAEQPHSSPNNCTQRH
ncbi:hypothetical protein TRVL_06006 [Trypanosoma vivax]|nr:hypothetical protein TRVL_06006 [Trypanosoma vivax]